MEPDMLDVIWQRIQSELDAIRKNVQELYTRTERAETSGGGDSVLLADAPLSADGANSGDFLFISNGRKGGEGAGAGTGVPAYYNSGTNTWKRYEDNADVTI